MQGEAQVVGVGLIRRSHGIAVLKDTAHHRFKLGIHLGLEEIPQVVGLVGRNLLDRDADGFGRTAPVIHKSLVDGLY